MQERGNLPNLPQVGSDLQGRIVVADVVMEFLPDFNVAPAEGQGVRSRDLKGKTFEWTDLKIVHEFGEDSPYKGHAVAYVDHPDDLARLGKTMGHCAGTHFVWACEERIWAFFTIITTADMQPHTTLHAKQLKWVGKRHPRDTAEYPYVGRGKTCPDCGGYGGHGRDGRPFYYGDPGIIRCKKCNGTGNWSANNPDAVPYPKASAGGYPTYADVVKAFESVGRKYEAGKYAPLSFDSQTYEIPKGYKEPLQNFEGLFGRYTIKQRPAGVDDETWATYEKTVAAMKAQFDKGNGAVQIVGRTFKFDSKEWYVLSFSGRGQGRASNTAYRGMLHEFFVAGSKKKKKKEADGN